MSSEKLIDKFYTIVLKEGAYSNRGNLEFHFKNLFKGIDFENKRVLDIGGGIGLHSFYAAVMGAKEVICLEPEAEGSRPSVNKTFERLKSKMLPFSNQVTLLPIPIQSFRHKDRKFNIILLHNSINHLDENACIHLLEDEIYKDIYRDIFSRISSLSDDGARLIICDCSRYNFFSLLGIRNPFARIIEWHKHQAPETWADLLTEVGFYNTEIQWSSFNTLRSAGKLVLGNKFMSYFLRSHFCLTMEKAR